MNWHLTNTVETLVVLGNQPLGLTPQEAEERLSKYRDLVRQNRMYQRSFISVL